MREASGAFREPHGLAIRAARTAWAALRGPTLWISLLAGAFLAFAGAFGTGDAPAPQRFAFWLSTMALSGLAGRAIAEAVASRRPGRSRLAMWAQVSAAATAPATLIVWALGGLLLGPYPPGALLALLPTTALVSGAMTAIILLARPPVVVTHERPSDARTAAAQARFLARIPARLGGAELYAVEAEDHYLRVRTSRGSDLILMRLSDAVAELEGIEGAQVHRSWWVARGGIAEVRRGAGKVTLVLRDGSEAPVSRANLKRLREAGWFSGG